MPNQQQWENHTLNPAPYQLMLPFDVGVRIEATERVRLLLASPRFPNTIVCTTFCLKVA